MRWRGRFRREQLAYPGQITLPDGRPGLIVLRHPMPGERGNLGVTTMEGVGLWLFDTAMSKTFRIGESKSVQLRVDAQNILNHPTPNDPGASSGCTNGASGDNLSIVASTNDFGRIGSKCVAESTPGDSKEVFGLTSEAGRFIAYIHSV